MQERKATTYLEIVGINKQGELVVLEDIFQYGDNGLKGATGFTMRPLTQEEIDERNEPSELKEYWQQAVEAGTTEDSLEDWTELAKSELGERQYFPFDDNSFRYDTDNAYSKLSDENKAIIDKEFGEIEKDFVDYDCVGCGRCLPTDHKDYRVLLRPDLHELIVKAEEKAE